jgi:hypothetical protein
LVLWEEERDYYSRKAAPWHSSRQQNQVEYNGDNDSLSAKGGEILGFTSSIIVLSFTSFKIVSLLFISYMVWFIYAPQQATGSCAVTRSK